MPSAPDKWTFLMHPLHKIGELDDVMFVIGEGGRYLLSLQFSILAACRFPHSSRTTFLALLDAIVNSAI